MITPEDPLMRIDLDCGFALKALLTRQSCAELQLQPGSHVTALIKAPQAHLRHASGKTSVVRSECCNWFWERSRLVCCLARPRAEPGRAATHQTILSFRAQAQVARARPAAPAAGALPISSDLFLLGIIRRRREIKSVSTRTQRNYKVAT
jgi:hypothetical protein